jgi:hypothetical protein
LKYNKYLFLVIGLSLAVSCSENLPDTEPVPSIKVDFLINNDDLESLGFDYSPTDLNLFKNDPDKVFFAQVGELIEFKDISAADIPINKTWLLDGEEWKANEISTGDFPGFEYTFDVAGLYKVSLSMGDLNVATKYVRVLDRNGVDMMNRTEPSFKRDSTEEKRPKSNEEISGVNFIASGEKLIQGESVTFTDNTILEEEIDIRVWDFGDGTVMPTKGNRVKYNYILPGTYTVKLCLNYSDLCQSKIITVNHRPKENGNRKVAVREVKPDKTNSTDSKERIFRSIGFDSPSKTKIGMPIRFTDKSTPISSVWKRDWFINGEKQNYSHQFVDMVFDKSGEYVIKMCLNNQRANCIEKRIKVFENKDVSETEVILAEAKKEPVKKDNYAEALDDKNVKVETQRIPPSYLLNPIKDEFVCRSYSKAGFKAKYRCLEEKAWYKGRATIKIIPRADMELLNTIVYGSEVGLVDVLILSSDNKVQGRLENVQILPGHTSIELSEMGLTLRKGKSYYLVIIPLERKGKFVSFESAVACKQFYAEEDHVSLDFFQDAYILFDIKYCY